MPTSQTSTLIRHLRTAALLGDQAGLTDAHLLGRFIEHRDQAAFALLLRRHGPMVLGVCRRVLHDGHDADDAFQATFLVLVRKAASIRSREAVANWLYGVAYHTAQKARAMRGKRQARERRVTDMPEPEAVRRSDTWHDLQPLLDEELHRLPDKYRIPVVLCDLEGKTRKEAARQLGVPEGTVSSRLGRARGMLARRLTRRGLKLSGGALAATLAGNLAPASVPAALAASTIKAAALVAAGQAAAGGVVPAQVVALTEGVLKAMLLSKLKSAGAVLVVLGLVTLACGMLAGARAGEERDPAGPPPAAAADRPAVAPDSGGGGLSEFQKAHKYRIDPSRQADADWQGRREHTYSVRAVVRVMPPYNLKAMSDDYQDVRVLAEKKEYAELEVVVYPLNTNAEAIKANPNWKKDYAGMKEYLEPGVTTNWDDAMRQDLLRELAKDGIDPDKLADKEVVEQVSRWLFQRCKYRYMFCTFYAEFPEGKPVVRPGLEQAFEREKGDKDWTVRQQFEHELLGKEMFANKCVGTCTSSAVLQATVLRALGIPTRMILCIPLADGSDPAQVAVVEKGLTHNRVRRDAFYGVLGSSGGFTSHTFCEVFVGGRWRRLNYAKLGQNVLEPNYLGVMIHVHTFRDLSEANLAATWGTRYAKGQRDDVFRHSNPYRLMEVSDHFGKYAKEPNPPASEHTSITIGKAYWLGSKDVPEYVRDHAGRPPQDGSGRLFFHGEEWLNDAGDYLQYKAFLWRADPEFILKAKDQPDVKARVGGTYYTHATTKLREMEVVIPAPEMAKMAKGVAYTIHPVNGKKGYEWKVRDGVTVTRE
jgi:RNA polymerase sigma factor (sigma-70 family)